MARKPLISSATQARKRKSLVAPGATEKLASGVSRGGTLSRVGRSVRARLPKKSLAAVDRLTNGGSLSPYNPTEKAADVYRSPDTPNFQSPSGADFYSTEEPGQARPTGQQAPSYKTPGTTAYNYFRNIGLTGPGGTTPVKSNPILNFVGGDRGQGQSISDINRGFQQNQQNTGQSSPLKISKDETIFGRGGRDAIANKERQVPVSNAFYSTLGVAKPSATFGASGNFTGITNKTGNQTIDAAYAKILNPDTSVNERAAASETLRREQEFVLGNTGAGKQILDNINRQSQERANQLQVQDNDLYSAFDSQRGVGSSLEGQIQLQNQQRLRDAQSNYESQKSTLESQAASRKRQLEQDQNQEVNRITNEYNDRIRDELQNQGFDTDRSGENLTRSELDRAAAIENKILSERDDRLNAVKDSYRAELNNVDSTLTTGMSDLNNGLFAFRDQMKQQEIEGLQGRDDLAFQSQISLADFASKETYKLALEQQFATSGLSTEELVSVLKNISQTDDPTLFMQQIQLVGNELENAGLNFDMEEYLESAGQRKLFQDLQARGQEALIGQRNRSNVGGESNGFSKLSPEAQILINKVGSAESLSFMGRRELEKILDDIGGDEKLISAKNEALAFLQGGDGSNAGGQAENPLADFGFTDEDIL